jgi:hypothetical protein
VNPIVSYRFLFFLYDPLTTSLHGLKKSIIHEAIKQRKTFRSLKYLWKALVSRVDGVMKFGISIVYVKSHSVRFRQYIDII